MEHNLPLSAKKIWSIVRVVFYMLRKEISKRRIMADLNMMMKRGKIAGKAIGNLMFPHHAAAAASRRSHDGPSSSSSATAGPLEYEFSCNNSPAFPYHLPNLYVNKRKGSQLNHHFHNLFMCAHPPPTKDDDDVVGAFNFDKAIMEMLSSQREVVEASPMLPGFGRTPLVRPLRITDSPFPLKEEEEDDDRVDKAAEEFIENFYRELRKQK
ncbi:uncharacterized protein LOC115678480 [Syzygium oleosum]|uniref:uncharacterized protein LOC115678480 n=1 Tax=Syzygium oleosum TaxID=219896 RepID=UPI0011D1E3C9|nr:uncharacterized protein LOC115678480 [Syzygium oleosum]